MLLSHRILLCLVIVTQDTALSCYCHTGYCFVMLLSHRILLCLVIVTQDTALSCYCHTGYCFVLLLSHRILLCHVIVTQDTALSCYCITGYNCLVTGTQGLSWLVYGTALRCGTGLGHGTALR